MPGSVSSSAWVAALRSISVPADRFYSDGADGRRRRGQQLRQPRRRRRHHRADRHVHLRAVIEPFRQVDLRTVGIGAQPTRRGDRIDEDPRVRRQREGAGAATAPLT